MMITNLIQNSKGCCSIVDIHSDYMHRPFKETLVTIEFKILYCLQIVFICVPLFSRK